MLVKQFKIACDGCNKQEEVEGTHMESPFAAVNITREIKEWRRLYNSAKWVEIQIQMVGAESLRIHLCRSCFDEIAQGYFGQIMSRKRI